MDQGSPGSLGKQREAFAAYVSELWRMTISLMEVTRPSQRRIWHLPNGEINSLIGLVSIYLSPSYISISYNMPQSKCIIELWASGIKDVEIMT
jgi:hypothetical protein